MGGFGNSGYRFDGDDRDDFNDDFADSEFYDDFDDRSGMIREEYDGDFDDGLDEDYDDGYGQYDDGFVDDFDDGYNDYGDGYNESGQYDSDGFSDDFDDGSGGYQGGYNDGYGYDNGGYQDGYNNGYQNGYNGYQGDYNDGYGYDNHYQGGVNYADFEDAGAYDGRAASRNVMPEKRGRRETQSERYDRYAEDLKKKRQRMRAPSGTSGDFYDYDTSADYGDGYDNSDDYYGDDFGPADRTPEPIPPIYAKYLGNGSGSGEATYYEEHYGKTAKKNNAVSLSSYRARKRLKALGIVAASFAVIGAIVYYFTLVHIYNPVNIDNSIVNLQTSDATKMLQSVIGTKLGDKTLKIVVNGETFPLNLGEYGFNYSADADGSVNTVTEESDDGKEVKTSIATYKNILYNQTKLEGLLNSISDKYGTTMIKPSYTIEGDQLIIKAGSDGVGVDENSLMSEILERIKAGNYEDALVEELVTTKTPDVNIDQIYKEVSCEVKDASSYVDENGETIYSPDVVGKKFNLEDARATIAAGGNTWSITMNLTQPKITLVELKAPTCPELLSETTTSFDGGNKTRAANIKNAAKRINNYGSFEDGYVLQPGEIFSYNDTVGERTEANGFSIATVYTSTGTTNDVGGGICQVSSAIFSAAFKADLEIVSRTNHMYKVHYWTTPGEDATVNWGTIDFKFQNSKSYPIKIKMIYKSKDPKFDGKDSISCQIWGTDDGYHCEFDNKTVQMVKTTVVEKKATATKPRGKIEWGDPGLTIEIYRVRYKGDVKISKELYATSVYQPLATVKYV